MALQSVRTPGRRAVRFRAVALLAGAVTTLVACGGGPIDTSATGGRIVWGKPAEVADLDPTTTAAATTYQLLDQIYEPLVGLDDDLKPIPKLARSWTQKSPTRYVFDIRRGVKFSNGREMTADDVVGSLDRLIDPKLAALWAVQLGPVTSVSATGPWQVEIVLDKPNSALVPALAYINAAVLPIKELKAGTLDTKKATLGTGPYMVESHQQDEVWNLVRNPHYWRKGVPKADKLTVRIVPDDAARLAGLRDGSIDAANFDSPDSVKLLAGQPNIKTAVVPTTEFYRLDVNATTSVLKDRRLREAISLALDRKKIADVALAGTAQPTAAVSPNFGTCPSASIPHATPDPARAARLVDAAGATGKTLSLLAVDINKPILQIAQVVAPQLQAIGFKVKIEQVSEGQMFARAYTGKTDFDLVLAYFGSLADPSMGLNWWSASQGWHKAWLPVDKELETLIAESHREQPGAGRDATIKAACDRIATNANIIPLVTKPNVVAYRADRVTADIPKTEAYFNPMRHLPGFSVKAPG